MKRAQREFYDAGEYYALSSVLAPAAAALVEAAGVAAGADVLDVGAGDGNVAGEAARRGATVVATDLSPAQVERGMARSRREGTAIEWHVADVEALPFADGVFSHVLSAFGAVAAPHPEITARELFRVCRPGGLVALTAWPPDSFMGRLADAVRRATPPGFAFPDQELGWGIEEVARERFAPFAAEVSCSRPALPYDGQARAAAGQADFVARYFREHLPEAAAPAVSAARDEVVRKFSTGGTITAEYLLVVARAR